MAEGEAARLQVELTWTAPDTCPSREKVLADLAAAVDAGDNELPPLRAHATVSPEGSLWRLELTTAVEGIHGKRQLEADSCEGLAHATTLVLSLALGEGLARRRAAAEARAQPPAPVRPPAALARPRANPQRERARRALWAGTTLASDPLRAIAPGVVLGFAYQPSLLQLQAKLGASAPRTTQLGQDVGSVRGYGLSAELAACLAPAYGSLLLSGCMGGGATLLHVEGRGTAGDRSAFIPLYGLGPGLNGWWFLGRRGFISVGLASRFFVARPELVVKGVTEQRRIAVASLSAELAGGLAW